MSTPSRFLRGSRALLAASKSAASTPKPSDTAASALPKALKDKKPPSGSGIQKLAPVSPAFQDFVGAPQISRAQAVKKVWAHIKENNLQNPANKREIFLDAKLKKLFDGKEKVGFLEIARLISPHFVKTG